MSTRSATIVKARMREGSKELFRFYRHMDGYPDGHGFDMAYAFAMAEVKNTADDDRTFNSGLNNRNWTQKCFAELFSSDCDLEVEPFGYQHWDIDYLYVVEGVTENYGGKHKIDTLPVTITVYENTLDFDNWSYDAIIENTEPLFSGSPLDYMDWCGQDRLANAIAELERVSYEA